MLLKLEDMRRKVPKGAHSLPYLLLPPQNKVEISTRGKNGDLGNLKMRNFEKIGS